MMKREKSNETSGKNNANGGEEEKTFYRKKTIIKMSDKGIFSLITKGFISLFLFWIFIILVYFAIRAAFGYAQIIKGISNTFFFEILIVVSSVILMILLFIIGRIIQASIEAEVKENELLVRIGVVWPRELILPYSELKEARIMGAPLQFVDNFFGVNDIAIEGRRITTINDVEDADIIVKDINDRITASKKKTVSIEDLLKEIDELKKEINNLKKEKEKWKGEEKIIKGEKKRKFEAGPLEEEL